jgi:hypothetical protein
MLCADFFGQSAAISSSQGNAINHNVDRASTPRALKT